MASVKWIALRLVVIFLVRNLMAFNMEVVIVVLSWCSWLRLRCRQSSSKVTSKLTTIVIEMYMYIQNTNRHNASSRTSQLQSHQRGNSTANDGQPILSLTSSFFLLFRFSVDRCWGQMLNSNEGHCINSDETITSVSQQSNLAASGVTVGDCW